MLHSETALITRLNVTVYRIIGLVPSREARGTRGSIRHEIQFEKPKPSQCGNRLKMVCKPL